MDTTHKYMFAIVDGEGYSYAQTIVCEPSVLEEQLQQRLTRFVADTNKSRSRIRADLDPNLPDVDIQQCAIVDVRRYSDQN